MLVRLRDYGFILAGAVLQALAMDLFLVPGRLAAAASAARRRSSTHLPAGRSGS